MVEASDVLLCLGGKSLSHHMKEQTMYMQTKPSIVFAHGLWVKPNCRNGVMKLCAGVALASTLMGGSLNAGAPDPKPQTKY